MKKRFSSLLGAILVIILSVDCCSLTAHASFLINTNSNKIISTDSSEIINTDSSEWYDSVRDSNLQMRQNWQEQKYEWMNPNNFLAMDDSEMKRLSDEIVKECRNDYEKVKAVHDWVCDNVYYDYEAYTEGFGFFVVHDDEEGAQFESMSTYERLLYYKRGVCAYYSSIFSQLVRAQGIPCMKVSGFAAHNKSILTAQTSNHDWNEAYVNNHWIIIDTTWDSLNKYLNGEYIHGGFIDTYFDISDDAFAYDHRIMEYPDVKKYSVIKQIEIKGGSIEVSPTQAFAGQKVTINIKPESGYQLDKLDVTHGNEISVSRLGENMYSFLMPDSAVTVSASFSRKTQISVSNFCDVLTSDYYADTVLWAVENGITFGTTATTFSPNQSCTRAQIITFLWRAAGSPEPQSVSPFFDVTPGIYYDKATAWAAENGIESGTIFAPDAPCTRLMAVEFMWKYAGSPSAAAVSFTDVSSAAVNWAVENDVTRGTGASTFSPDANCTRAQIVTFLYRAYAN